MSSPRCPKKFPYFLCATLLPVSAALSADPRVAGNTISWPDDGWYQVQDANTYASICEGGRSCEVLDGTYIVINHHSGQRYEGVVVPAIPPGDAGIVIDGNVISWPDDGWYQVQDATTYASLCEGGRSCEVPAATYHVINHTTGKRHENLVVEEDPVVDPSEDPQISAANALALLRRPRQNGGNFDFDVKPDTVTTLSLPTPAMQVGNDSDAESSTFSTRMS